MQMGMVGLGRMGGNMAERLMKNGHKVVVYDRNAETVATYAGKGATGAASIADFVSKLEKPRVAWVMVPCGAPTEQSIKDLAQHPAWATLAVPPAAPPARALPKTVICIAAPQAPATL